MFSTTRQLLAQPDAGVSNPIDATLAHPTAGLSEGLPPGLPVGFLPEAPVGVFAERTLWAAVFDDADSGLDSGLFETQADSGTSTPPAELPALVPGATPHQAQNGHGGEGGVPRLVPVPRLPQSVRGNRADAGARQAGAPWPDAPSDSAAPDGFTGPPVHPQHRAVQL